MSFILEAIEKADHKVEETCQTDDRPVVQTKQVLHDPRTSLLPNLLFKNKRFLKPFIVGGLLLVVTWFVKPWVFKNSPVIPEKIGGTLTPAKSIQPKVPQGAFQKIPPPPVVIKKNISKVVAPPKEPAPPVLGKNKSTPSSGTPEIVKAIPQIQKGALTQQIKGTAAVNKDKVKAGSSVWEANLSVSVDGQQATMPVPLKPPVQVTKATSPSSVRYKRIAKVPPKPLESSKKVQGKAVSPSPIASVKPIDQKKVVVSAVPEKFGKDIKKISPENAPVKGLAGSKTVSTPAAAKAVTEEPKLAEGIPPVPPTKLMKNKPVFPAPVPKIMDGKMPAGSPPAMVSIPATKTAGPKPPAVSSKATDVPPKERVAKLMMPEFSEDIQLEGLDSSEEETKIIKNAIPPKPRVKNFIEEDMTAEGKSNTKKQTEKKEIDLVPFMFQLPDDVQANLPDIHISFHSYSENPAGRIVSINGKVLREGMEMDGGLTLEKITLKGVVLLDKSQKFKVEL